MQCDMCGAEGAKYRTNVEGAILNLCEKCSSYGKVVETIRPELKQKKLKKAARQEVGRPQIMFVITQDYAQRIKQKRESLGLKQLELAKKLNERESLLSKLESGAIEPSISLARKLEKFLGITLVEEHKEEQQAGAKPSGEGITLGDLIKIRQG